jgi:hypothetical protein
MSIEGQLFSVLSPLAAGRVYPDVAPQNVLLLPRITYQQVGGDAVNFLDQDTLPSKRNARFQVNGWAATRLAAAQLSHDIEDALRAVPALQATVLGAPVAVFEPDTKLYGTHQDFSLWS